MLTRSRLSLLAVLAAACSGDTLTAPDVRTLHADQVGLAPSAVVMHEVNVRVVVTDANDAPVAGQVVNFVVTVGGGSVYAPTAITNADGEASELWTLGPTAGGQVIEARAVDPASGLPLLLGKATATATADVPVSISPADVVFYPKERRVLADVLNARDQYGNAATLAAGIAKLTAGLFAAAGDTVTAPDTLGVSGLVDVTVGGITKTIHVFTSPNYGGVMVYRSACPSVGYDSVVQVTVQDAVKLSPDRQTITLTGRTTSMAYWSGGQIVASSGPSHAVTTGALAITVRPDTLKSAQELFVRSKGARFEQVRFPLNTTNCLKPPTYGAAYIVE